MFHCVLLHLLIIVIYPTLMVLSGLRHLLHLHLALLLPLLRLYPPTTERARCKEQAFSQLLRELSPFSDMTVVPSIIDLQTVVEIGTGKSRVGPVNFSMTLVGMSGRKSIKHY